MLRILQDNMIISNISQALSVEKISDFRRFKVTSDHTGEYCSFYDPEAITKDKIVFDVECVKKIKSNVCYKSIPNDSDLSILFSQRKYPKHNDYFLFDINSAHFSSLSSKERSGLIHRLIRCIDLTYVLMLETIQVTSSSKIINNNDSQDIGSSIPWVNLTGSELSYLQIISVIGTSKEIANSFDLSPRTIEKIIADLGKKLKIYNKMELQLFAKFITSHIDIPYEVIPYSILKENSLPSDQYQISRINHKESNDQVK